MTMQKAFRSFSGFVTEWATGDDAAQRFQAEQGFRRARSHSRKYRPYRAFRALGLVTRTLLRYLSEPKLREQNTANRADAIRCFADSLGGKLIGHNDPDYLEKMIKFSNRSPPSEPGSLS